MCSRLMPSRRIIVRWASARSPLAMLSTHARHSSGFATGKTVTAKVSVSAPPSEAQPGCDPPTLIVRCPCGSASRYGTEQYRTLDLLDHAFHIFSVFDSNAAQRVRRRLDRQSIACQLGVELAPARTRPQTLRGRARWLGSVRAWLSPGSSVCLVMGLHPGWVTSQRPSSGGAL